MKLFNKEEILLLKTLGGIIDIEKSQALEERLYLLARRYGLTPFLYHYLEGKKYSYASQEIRDNLRNAYICNLHRVVNQKRDILDVAKHFYKDGIPLVVLKGPYMGEKIYGQDGIRTCSREIDLLIRYGNFAKAESSLSALDYRVRRYSQWYESRYNQILCYPPPDKFMIDLHQGPFPSCIPDLALDAYWSETSVENIEGTPLRFFSNEVFFLYRCIAFWREHSGVKRVRDVLDLYFFTSNNIHTFNGKHIKELIDEHDLNLYMSFCIEQLNDIFNFSSQIPDEFLDTIKAKDLRTFILQRFMTAKGIFGVGKFLYAKKKLIEIIIFSKGSLAKILRLLYLTYKADYLKNARYSGNVCVRTVRHFLSVLKKLYYAG